MPTLTKTIETTCEVSANELAELFCEMGSDQQAEFFAAIHTLSASWQGTGWCGQSSAIAEVLEPQGQEVIITLAQHVLGRDDLAAAARTQVQP